MKKLYTILLAILCSFVMNAQIVNIPSAEFKSVLTSQICADTNDDGILDNDVDTNDDGEIQLSEALAVGNLDTLGKPFRNMTGIEAFTNLKSLVCSGAGVQFFTLSGLPNLKTLNCAGNNIYSISLTGLNQLETLDCSQNPLMTFMNFSGLNNLKTLNCSKGRLANLNLTDMTSLETLNCAESYLTSLTLPAGNNILHLNISRNPLLVFDFTAVPNLKTLECNWSGLTTIDVSSLMQLESLTCIAGRLTTLNVSNLTNLKDLYCTYNSINTLDLTNATSLVNLNCDSNNLTALNISNATNLETLICSNNSIITLDVSNLSHLKTLDCNTNSLTTLNINGATQIETVNCNLNALTVLDASNLVNLKSMDCGKNLLTALSVSNLAQLKALDCATNNLPALNLSGLTALETLDCSFNNLNTIDLSSVGQLKSLSCSRNHIPSIDTSIVPNLETLKCNFNEINTLTITNLADLKTLECSNNHIAAMDFGTSAKLNWFELDGNLFTTLDFSQLQGNGKQFRYSLSNNPNLTYVNIKNGCYLHTYSRHDRHIFTAQECPNLMFVCVDELNLGEVYVSPLTSINSYCSFVPGGTFNTISGIFTLDYDNNGCDANDNPSTHSKITIADTNNQTGATFTDGTGQYDFFTRTGDYTITPTFENPYFIVTPASAVVNFAALDSSTQTQHFCISPNGTHNDVELTLFPMMGPRPGFDTSLILAYKNKGNQIMSGSINFTFDDAVLDFVSSNIAVDSQTLNNLTWHYSNLMPFESRNIILTLNVNSPQEAPPINIGDYLNYTASITPVSGDETPDDNASTGLQIVRGSYDPNDKTCLEGDTLTPPMVGSYLHYVIRFQNKGTAAAENVVILDAIDTTKFDMSSFQLTSSSHPQVTKITNNKVEFQFRNINLPAEMDDEPGSHGYVAFKIKTKSDLILGDSIENKANIYFDYNFPVETNTATTVVTSLLSANTFENKSVTIAPNPVKTQLHITSKDNITSVQLFDVQGRILETVTANVKQVDFDLSRKANGVYFVKIFTVKGVKVEKVIKE